MPGRIETGQERLAAALDAAHEAVQEAHRALYDVQLATERAENDLLAGGMPQEAVPEYARMRTEISELRPLLVPIVRWLQGQRREVKRGD